MQNNTEILKAALNPARRKFFKDFGKLGLGAAAGGMLLSNLTKLKAQTSSTPADTAIEVLTAGTIAEDLATTFYYNALVGKVIQDPNLAGPGGSATNVTSSGNAPNVAYLRAAMAQEISHANLWRAVGNLGSSAATDPYQTFYFPAGTFDTLGAFIATLEALENAFIGTYLIAIREFATLAATTSADVPDGPFGGPFSAAQYEYFAQVLASVMGVECEHRVLGQVITNTTTPNDRNYEQLDGLLSVYNGPNSAVAALTPFLTSSTGPGYSLATALAAASEVGIIANDGPPAYHPASLTASPNPIPVAAGADLGMTTISWNAPSAQYIQVRVGAPDGALFADYFNSGSAPTGLWVSDGMTFYLQDISNGLPLTAANTLATLTVHLKGM